MPKLGLGKTCLALGSQFYSALSRQHCGKQCQPAFPLLPLRREGLFNEKPSLIRDSIIRTSEAPLKL